MSNLVTKALKRTTSANGKHYYYEKNNSNEEKSSWSRIDKGFYDFLIETYGKDVINISKDDKGNIIFIEYKNINKSDIKAYTTVLNDGKVKAKIELKQNKGCGLIFYLALLILTTYILELLK